MKYSSVISALYIYPLKGGRAIPVREALVLPAGLEGDRMLMVADENGRFLSQRQVPAMARLSGRVDTEGLSLEMDGNRFESSINRNWLHVSTVQVWEDRFPAKDAGDEAAEWLSKALNIRCRLKLYSHQTPRLREKEGISFAASFADGYPVLITNENSLEELNRKSGHRVPMNRFRPGIVVSGLQAREELNCKRVEINGISSLILRPSLRCQVPRIDQDLGIFDGPEPFRTLVEMGAGQAIFGMNAAFPGGLKVEVGQNIDWFYD